VFQDPRVGTIGDFTIMENMALALRRHQNRHLIPFASGKRRNFFRERLATLGMNLENRLDELVSRLSGGQRQALSLLMSVISDYKILLLDEITAALDPKSSEKVMSLADKIVSSEGKTCLMVTHNMHHARAFGDRTVILQNGIIGKQFSREEKQTTSPQDFIDALDGQG
jgi:putative ABC transport system ATP-binding protein